MSAGKGDWIPGTNDAAYHANYPTIDWNARERIAKALSYAVEVFGDEQKAQHWFNQPTGFLNGRTPEDACGHPQGFGLVIERLAQIEHGMHT